MELKIVGRQDSFDLFGLCHVNGYLVVYDSPDEFTEILRNDGFQRAVQILRPSKIALEQNSKRKWFLRLLVAIGTPITETQFN